MKILSSSLLTMFNLTLLLFFRLVLRRFVLVSCAYFVSMTVTRTFFSEAHPVIGWFVVGIWISLTLCVYLRLGILAGIIMSLTCLVLLAVPLTTNFSAWYAANGLAAIAVFLALAGFGFYTSQAGRPIFQEELLGER